MAEEESEVRWINSLKFQVSLLPAKAGLEMLFWCLLRGVAPGYFISRLQREDRALPDGRATDPLQREDNVRALAGARAIAFLLSPAKAGLGILFGACSGALPLAILFHAFSVKTEPSLTIGLLTRSSVKTM